MAIAEIETDKGTKIKVEGTAEEVAKIMLLYKQKSDVSEEKQKFKKFKRNTTSSPTLLDIIREQIEEGFFDKPKGLAELKVTLEEQGHFIPMTTLSGRILELVKNREIRRLKEESKWKYVKR